MTLRGSCWHLIQPAILLGAVLATAALHAAHVRRDETYGLGVVFGRGAVGAICGVAVGTGLCAWLEPDGGTLAAFARLALLWGGVAVVEGAVIGALVAFGIAWWIARRRSDAQDGDDPTT